MRQIILDTETTGLKPEEGHRIIEIGCVELIDRQPTSKTFHVYLNPGRKVETGAQVVHGITDEFLADKPSFSDIFEQFLDFVKDSEVIIHNAPFDIGFLTHEIKLLSFNPKVLTENVSFFDTLALARKMFPGQRNSLDALCKRFKIDYSERDLHGALLDAKLLAKVYLALTGGQTSLFDENEAETSSTSMIKSTKSTSKKPILRNPLRIIYANELEIDAHEKFIKKLTK